MFMQNQLLNEKANEFRTKRIRNVLNQEPFPNLDVNIPFFIHIIPYSFLDNQILDFSTADSDLTIKMRPMLKGGWDKMYNLDGFATFSLSNDRLKISAYNQIFRNGIYEIYTSDLFYETRNGKEGFDSSTFIETVIENINAGISNLNHMEIEPPFLISFSFLCRQFKLFLILQRIKSISKRSISLGWRSIFLLSLLTWNNCKILKLPF